MQKIYQLIFFWWHWYWDYVYVGFWQVQGFIFRANFKKYVNGDDNKPAIILLPGVYEKWQFMKPLADLFDHEGYRLHVIEALGYNRGEIVEAAEYVENYIAKHNLRRYIIVAHSKGGLIGKYVMSQQKAANCLGMVAVNTPFSGSIYAKYIPNRKLRMFSPVSKIILYLRGKKTVNSRIASVYSKFDPHIPSGSYLEGGQNIQVPVYGHFKPLGNKRLQKIVLKEVERLSEGATS